MRFFAVLLMIAWVLSPDAGRCRDRDSTSLAPYLSVRGVGAPALSPDGSTVIFSSSASGTSQLWRIPAHATPDSDCYWPVQLTFFSDAVTDYSFSPDAKWILFRKDIGGDERSQLYIIRPDGSGLDSLTHNHKAIFSGRFSPDGKSVLYQSNERKEAFFDIYRMDIATRAVTLLHRSDHRNSLVDMSPDGRWLFIARDSGNSNDFVYVEDLQHDKPTDEPRLLTPHSDEATYSGFYVSNDSKTLFFFTNQGHDFLLRAKLDFQNPSARIEFREEAHWDIDQDLFSRNETLEVMTRNEDGTSSLHCFDYRSGTELPLPKLPDDGFISNMQVSDNGTKVAFNFTSPREVGSIYVYDVPAHRFESITKPELAGLDPNSFVRGELIHYPSFDGTLIPAYYYGAVSPARAHPVIVMMHGGPEDETRPWFTPIVQYFLQRGYSVLAPNVRGSTGYGKEYASADNTTHRLTSVHDMEMAARWLMSRHDVDPKRLVIFGGSYGGFMSLAGMTMQSDLWAAGVDLFGIANFHTFLRNTGSWRASNRMSEYGNIEKDSAFLAQISPINHIQDIKHPLFVYQGKNDPRVPFSEAEQIVSAMKKRGIPVEYILLPDEGHGLSKRENRVKVYTAIADFLDRVLK